MRYTCLISLVLLLSSSSCRGQQRVKDDPGPTIETKSVNMNPAEIQVPHTNVQTCHDGLKKSVPSLWEVFDTQLVPAANEPGVRLARLDHVLKLRSQAWEDYLTHGEICRFHEPHPRRL